MDCSERTKRRRIAAKVEAHLLFIEKESKIDFLAHDSETERPLDDLLEHSVEGSPDTFYEACDQNCFENSSNDLEDENSSDFFYNCNISSVDDLNSENWVPGEMPGCDSDCDSNGDECSDLVDDNDDSHGQCTMFQPVTTSPETPRAQIRDSVLVSILRVLEELKQTQRVHERMLQTILHQQGSSGTTVSSTPEGFPLKTVSDVEVMEEKLANPDFM